MINSKVLIHLSRLADICTSRVYAHLDYMIKESYEESYDALDI